MIPFIPLAALSLKAKIIAYLAGAAVVLLVYATWHYRVYRSGYNAAIEAIAAQDKEAVHAADQARARVRNCYDTGGVWQSGACQR